MLMLQLAINERVSPAEKEIISAANTIDAVRTANNLTFDECGGLDVCAGSFVV